ncbi:MAG: 23S rRNA (guanosine(2251)-2'-O)-methyltransferase RlmB [Alphaproteobacteria bacterium]|jgi:23S rRNA (guanosine2251-2'-O)-methyltransferase|nr:23S rRNA (guanosine(2251)-2'-O)-methyltransferase RlmB [Alphaproteobacteria bacterium]
MKKENLLYGIHAVSCALKNEKRKINRIFATLKGIENLAKFAKVDNYRVVIKKKHEIDDMLPEGAVHQGVVLDCEHLNKVTLEDVINRADEKSVVLILDQVSDPHNIGAIIRSVSAFGADAVIVQEKNSPNITGLVAKIACGGVEEAPMVKVVNLSRSMEKLKENGYWIIGLDERGKCELSSTGLEAGKIAIVLGAEGPGIRDLVLKKCDLLARIPMSHKSKVSSINVSNAAVVALYEFFRK